MDERPAHDHFKGKDAIEHVAETQAEGVMTSSEVHGTELPGHYAAALDAAMETSVLMAILWMLMMQSPLTFIQMATFVVVFGCGWIVWKMGRSAWLGWSRLERLHRVLAQEKWEIEHNRPQEREELRVLYHAKGFEGKLLEDIVDVLMADGDRLLRVMVEEELNLRLESQEHPLRQCIGAGLGTLLAITIPLIGALLWVPFGLFIGCAVVLSVSVYLSAHYLGNRRIPAIVWCLAIASLSFGFVYFLIQQISQL